MHVVSGSLSLPALGCFSPFPHGTRSLSVTRESLALEGGPPGFTPDYSGRALLRNSTTPGPWSSPTGLSPSMAGRSSRTSADVTRRVCGSYYPAATRTTVWALPRSLAATEGISVDFSCLRVLRCFSSPGSLAFRRDRHRWRPGFPIRAPRDQSVCAAPPGLSQLTAPFIAFVCQGILDMHSLA
jgi:hypothetical protein